MSGEKIVLLNSLHTRKQLLLMESEMNRVELGREMARLDGEVTHLVNEGKFLFSAAGTLFTGIKLIRQFWPGKRSEPDKTSVWSAAFKQLIRLGTDFWLKTRPNPSE